MAMATDGDRPRLLLVGAGHAHLEVLRRLAGEAEAPFAATIVSPTERHLYSGMTPGYLAGRHPLDELAFDVPALAARAGARWVRGEAAALDPAAREVALGDGRRLGYDLVSLNVGSLAAGADADAVRRAERIKPLERAVRVRERLVALAEGGGGRRRDGGGEAARGPLGGREAPPAEGRAEGAVVIVGGGAAGVEVACAAAAVLSSAAGGDEAGTGESGVVLVEAGDALLAEHPPAVRRRAAFALDALGIATLAGRRVVAVEEDRVRLDDGATLAAGLTIWLTGAAAPPFLAGSGLPVDDRGFLLVDRHLRSLGDRRVFAAGDCATLADHPETPKAGVYAVRQAPVLWRGLVAAARGEAPRAAYRPQRRFLALLDTGDGRALLAYGRLALWTRWALRLKQRIDRRFVARYRRLPT